MNILHCLTVLVYFSIIPIFFEMFSKVLNTSYPCKSTRHCIQHQVIHLFALFFNLLLSSPFHTLGMNNIFHSIIWENEWFCITMFISSLCVCLSFVANPHADCNFYGKTSHVTVT